MIEAIHPDHLFVDEAGDLTLFDKRGKVIVGAEGVSRFFMLGVVYLPDPARAQLGLDALRRNLLGDPYFTGVPSMQPEQRKTAVFFHAKDDLPEVRREVFALLRQIEAKVRVAVRRKSVLANEAIELYKRGYKIRDNVIYDELVRWLFRGMIKPDRHAVIAFARRGKSDRLTALSDAITHAIDSEPGKRKGVTTIYADQPAQSAGLQVIDYYLWALQRLFERGEDRFLNIPADQFELIMDLDDKSTHPTGEWYDAHNPIKAGKIKLETG